MNDSIKVVNQNRRARFEYELLEKFEAGIVLTGAEIKSIRKGGASLSESYVRPAAGELWLLGAHIAPYAFSNNPLVEYNPTRERKLLMHRREIAKLETGVSKSGLTIIALELYLKRGRAKLQIALARGKASPDKRQSIKKREGEREMARALKQR